MRTSAHLEQAAAPSGDVPDCLAERPDEDVGEDQRRRQGELATVSPTAEDVADDATVEQWHEERRAEGVESPFPAESGIPHTCVRTRVVVALGKELAEVKILVVLDDGVGLAPQLEA